MRSTATAALVTATLAACGDNLAIPDAGPPRVEVALVPTRASERIDLLFVVQSSCCALDKQSTLKVAMPSFFDELAAGGQLPSIHVGVVSSDLGTSSAGDAEPGASIGSGPGSCAGTGDSGTLQTNGSTLVTGNFISDLRNSDGTRTTNYTGTLAAAFAEIASLGASGCAFEQPLRAARAALDANPANTGFRRGDAALAVILLAEDEDCSAASTGLFDTTSGALGTFGTFRCIRYGITCEDGGSTPDEMAVPGPKARCHSNEQSEIIAPVRPLVAFLEDLVPDPRALLLATIAGDVSPVDVVESTWPDGTSRLRVAPSCSVSGPYGSIIAEPGVRLAEATTSARRHVLASACNADYTEPMVAIARQLRSMTGDTCLVADIALPADCEVVDELRDGTATAIPRCDATRTDGCYELVGDTRCHTPHQLRVDVRRAAAPLPDSMVSVRCVAAA